MNQLDQYLAQHSSSEPSVLEDLTRQTHLRLTCPRMLSGHVQGRLLAMLTSIIAPRRVLEIGTFTGYSAISMALEMAPESELVTIDINDETEAIAAEFFRKAGVQNIVNQMVGDAIDIIAQLKGKFDLVFIDADKRSYCHYYNLLWDSDLISSGTVIIADNTLWDGKVLDRNSKHNAQTVGVMSFNNLIASDVRVDKVIVPLRDGLSIIRVK